MLLLLLLSSRLQRYTTALDITTAPHIDEL
jgi:hypothetical protein